MTAGAILALLTTLVSVGGGLWLFYARRKHTPTTQERIDDADQHLDRLSAEIDAAVAAGDDALAERLRRERLRSARPFYQGGRGTSGD
jgi:hypothetical protein